MSAAWSLCATCEICNDGYRPIYGAKHPHSMGQEVRECWSLGVACHWSGVRPGDQGASAGGLLERRADDRLRNVEFGHASDQIRVVFGEPGDYALPKGRRERVCFTGFAFAHVARDSCEETFRFFLNACRR